MKIVFVSNYFSHHQKPLSDALAKRADYAFVATEPMSEERRALGWNLQTEPEYVVHYDQDPRRVDELLTRADVVIAGSAPEHLIHPSIRRGQLVLRYAERPLKKGSQWHKYIPRLIKWHRQNPPGKRIYLLCASAYTAGDYARFGLFRGRAFRWGYFPETKCYEDTDRLMKGKIPGSILWAGRFLDWKHPDDAVRTAARLKEAGIEFQMNIIGRGEMEDVLRRMIEDARLQDCVHLLGAMNPEAVRQYMEQSQIFLFTSDRQEGWGAVLNEAMNSGCAVVAGDAAGASPYLVRDQENGMRYPSGDTQQLYLKTLRFLTDPDMADRCGRKAYETILQEWNADTAAERLLKTLKVLLDGTGENCFRPSGPCSSAGE